MYILAHTFCPVNLGVTMVISRGNLICIFGISLMVSIYMVYRLKDMLIPSVYGLKDKLVPSEFKTTLRPCLDSVTQSQNCNDKVTGLHHTTPHPTDAVKDYITSTSPANAGLGNVMFSYASLMGIAIKNNMKPLFDYSNAKGAKQLRTIFQVNVAFRPDGDRFNWSQFHEKTFSEYDKRTEMIKTHHKGNISMQGYFQSWKYFMLIGEVIRSQFRLTPKMQTATTMYLRDVIPRELNGSEYISVGIHVRRGDLLTAHAIGQGYRTAPVDYFHKAMDYFRKRFASVIFLVCSDDKQWAKIHLNGTNVIHSAQSSDLSDFAILTMTNHSIMSVGTFGWWSSWLCNGTTIYYKYPFQANSGFYRLYNQNDTFPPNWIAME